MLNADAKQAQGFISFFRKLPEVWTNHDLHPVLSVGVFFSILCHQLRLVESLRWNFTVNVT